LSVAARLIPPPVRRLFRRVFPHRPPDFADLWDRSCQKWIVASVEVQDIGGPVLVVHGWLMAPPDLRPHVGFRANGEGFAKTEYPLPRPDVVERSPYAANAESSGFILWKRLAGPDAGDLELTCVDERTGKPLGVEYRPFHFPGADRLGPVPDGPHMKRVIGEASAVSFALGGYTAFRRLEEAVREVAGESLAAYPRVLDWGCGCGRVSRYFLRLPGCQLTGVDVDEENVGWCRERLSAGTFATVPLRPPTQLPEARFDLAFGVSVFTHLSEPDQFAWLAELRRVVRPGGLALMTFHGEASVVWSGLTAERYARLRGRGFCEQANPLYDADLGEPGYYKDVFHTREYVRREWAKFFDVLAILPCYVAHQDLVVMRRV
jgi:SAM-dependent methyltransferase